MNFWRPKKDLFTLETVEHAIGMSQTESWFIL